MSAIDATWKIGRKTLPSTRSRHSRRRAYEDRPPAQSKPSRRKHPLSWEDEAAEESPAAAKAAAEGEVAIHPDAST